MMGERRVMQEALFYGFSLERHVPDDHLLRKIDRFVDLSDVRAHLEPYYSEVGRPSIDPELMIRMLIVGYCFGVRSERRLCEEVHLNLAYRWFCRLGLDGDVPDHSTFSKNRHGRFRESDLLRKLFETVVARCMKEGIVGGEAFAVDASMIVADAHRRRSVAKVEDLDPTSSRAVAEYLSVLDDAAFGGATPVEPKAISPTDPAARYTAAADKPAVYAYSDNYLIDLKNAVIMDVEATTAIRQAEVGAAKTMLDRTAEQFDVAPSRLVADAGYGSAEMIGWLVDERGIEPHVKLMDKSERRDGALSRSDFAFDPERSLYVYPGGKELKKYHRLFSRPRDGVAEPGRSSGRCGVLFLLFRRSATHIRWGSLSLAKPKKRWPFQLVPVIALAIWVCPRPPTYMSIAWAISIEPPAFKSGQPFAFLWASSRLEASIKL
jgi:transposase